VNDHLAPYAAVRANGPKGAALKADGFAGFVSLEPHLASTHELGGFSGPVAFGAAARAFAALAAKNGVALA
jgi:hypothetical protein